YLIAEAEAIDPVDPSIPVTDESKPLFTLLDIPCTGTPYKVPDELAEKILNHDGDMTVAVDLTINSNKGRSIIVSSCDSVNTSNPHFSTFVHSGGGIGVIYTGVDNGLEGWYTRGSGAGTGHHQLIYVASPTNGYTYYLDGSSLGTINGTKEYGLPNFGTQTGVNALYIGGTAHADTANKTNLSDATIHSVRFYDRALTANEATSLIWDNLSGIEDVMAGIDQRPISTGIYDMTGRRYNENQPLSSGFYIVNGTKTFVR
ncbi:MAG: LamG domain-containing protein, partial [Paramuribaculum sp.]|nr:LamG domain-containing protein [Paramuribaculum sp.]